MGQFWVNDVIYCVAPENIHTPPTRGFLNWTPPPYPPGNSILVSYFRSKNWAFETPLPLGISVNLPWGGHAYGYFLELHILTLNQALEQGKLFKFSDIKVQKSEF